MFLVYPKDAGWCKALANRLCFHRQYLLQDQYQKVLRFHYAKPFQRLVDEATKACPKGPPTAEALKFCDLP